MHLHDCILFIMFIMHFISRVLTTNFLIELACLFSQSLPGYHNLYPYLESVIVYLILLFSQAKTFSNGTLVII